MGTLIAMRSLNVLVRHVHGSWLDAFVRGPHTYVLPLDPGTGRGGKRAMWPANVVDVAPESPGGVRIDVVVAQSVADIEASRPFLGGREPLRDVPVVFLEHNAPEGQIADMRHPLADRGDVTIVHVTHANALFWDTGTTRTRLVEHGIPDPGPQFTGELASAAVVINEAERRGRTVGYDLLPRFAAEGAPLDRFGIGTPRDLPMAELHAAIGRRRVYLHPFRWTSLGLALLEAMACGMPVVALATTEVPRAVPPGAGVVSNDIAECCAGLRAFAADPERGREAGAIARASVLERYGLARFLTAWNDVLSEAVG